MDRHRYILEPYASPASRYTCPSCGHKRKFTRYIDVETRQHVADYIGRCNREHNCGHHYTPKQYFQANPSREMQPYKPINNKPPELHKPASLIPSDIFKQSLRGYKKNNFTTYLVSVFDQTTVDRVINRYYIGTSKQWPGAVVFWQVDIKGNVRAGKIMLYDTDTGHRVKEPFNHISWVHSALKVKGYNLQQCFFGEYLLLLYPDLPVAIVESEKTAIIASVYFPQFVWLATGGKNGCKWTTKEVWEVLKSRKVVLWPDVNAFHDWERKVEQLKQHGLNITISNLLEINSNDLERAAGLDLADFLVRFPIELFWKAPNPKPP